MTTKTFQLETVTCPSCIVKIQGMLKKIPGIEESEVLFNSSRVKVAFDEKAIDSTSIKNRIDGLGYRVLSEK